MRVVEFFGKVVELLKSYNPIYKAENWHPEIHAQGSEVPASRFSISKGYTFDLSFTSPPYFNTESYSESFVITLTDGTVFNVSELDSLEDEDGILIPSKDVHAGTLISYDGKLLKVSSFSFSFSATLVALDSIHCLCFLSLL